MKFRTKLLFVNPGRRPGTGEANIKQLIMSAKLMSILILAACLQVSASVHSQVSYKAKNASLQTVITVIENQTRYVFVYNDKVIAKAKPITVELTNAAIQTALDQIFKDQPLTYQIKGNSVVIIEKPQAGGKGVDLLSAVAPSNAEATPLPPVTIHGKVTDEKGEPVGGVTISIKGAKAIGSTDDKGEFSVSLSDANVTLVFSAMTIETFELKLNGRTELALNAKTKTNELQDVVVSKGYYTTTQRLNTGNVARVKGEDIQKQPVSDPLLALEGRVAGLYISQASGIPGAYSTVRLRGQNSIANGNNPLYIVDGVPFTSTSVTVGFIGGGAAGSPSNGPSGGLSPFNNLSPADIESIEVLKDADATAIYGSRGANGVVLITTKKGKAGKSKFDIDASSGFGKVAHMMPMMNTQQYLTMRREAFANDVQTPGANDLDLNGTWDATAYTNWQKVLIGATATFTNIRGSLSGGNENTQFLISSGYSKQTTVYPGDFADQKASLSFNVNHISANKKFHTLFSGQYIKDNCQLPAVDLTNSINIAPNAPSKLVDDNGNLVWTNIPFSNPMAQLTQNTKAITDNLISNLNIGYEILPGLEINGSFGYTHIQLNQDNITPAISFRPPNNTNASFRFNDQGTNDLETWIIEPQLNYTRKIKQGKLSVLVGTTFQENNQHSFGLRGTNFTSDDQIANIALAPTLTVRGNSITLYHYSALYGRLNYNWKEKYLLNMTARRDGSSRFGTSNQFGNFGAVGVGWIFSRERVIQNNLLFLSYGKLRVSYGSTGNDQLTDYKFLSTYSPYAPSTYQGVIGISPTQIPNPYYGWETVKKLEAGIELGFLQDRILFNLSYYQNRTVNQLVGYALPSTVGFSVVTANLPAVIQNSGMEIVLNTVNIRTKDFSWNSSMNVSVPNNKLVSYPGLASSNYASRYVEGRSLFIQQKYHATGVDPQTGIYIIDDVNKDGIINSNDQQFVKEVKQNFYGGFENSFFYKGFQLNVLFQFVKQTGNYYFSYIPGNFFGGTGNLPTFMIDRWQKPGDNTSSQKYSQQSSGTAQQGWNNAVNSGDYYIGDASFIRLKNLSLSYQLSVKWVNRFKLSELKLFIQGQNMFTITNYKGLDPETQGKGLPPLRMINFGIHASL